MTAITADRPGVSATAVLGQPLAVAVAALSIAAGVIHAAVTYEHLQEYLLFGMFFGVVASVQVVWGAALVADPSRRLIAAGLAGNLALLALWAVSRSAGLPLGPHHGAEAVSTTDLVCAVVEALAVVGAAALLVRHLRERRVRRSAAAWGLAAVGVVVAALLVLSLPAAFGGEEEHGEHAEVPAAGVVHGSPSHAHAMP